MTVSEAIQ